MEALNLAMQTLIDDVDRFLKVYIRSPTPTNLRRVTDRLEEDGFEYDGKGFYGSMERRNASRGRVYEIKIPLAHDRFLKYKRIDYGDPLMVSTEAEDRRRIDLMYAMYRLSAFVNEMNMFDLRTIKQMVEDPAIDPSLLRIPQKGQEPAFERWVFDQVKRHKQMVLHLRAARGTKRRGIPALSVEGPISDAIVRNSIFARSKTRKYLLDAFRLLDLLDFATSPTTSPTKKRKAA